MANITPMKWFWAQFIFGRNMAVLAEIPKQDRKILQKRCSIEKY